MQRLANKYRSAIHALSKRTNTPVPSLVASFLILHEVTAIVPFTTTFFIAKYYGFGPSLVAEMQVLASKDEHGEETWFQNKLHKWNDEGQEWVLRVGRRYSIFGQDASTQGYSESSASSKVAGDVTNALAAYLITKALLPIRLAASLSLAPAFSRRLLDPIRKYLFRSKS